MRTSQDHASHFGLQAIKTLVILMVIAGGAFFLTATTNSSLEKSFSHYQDNADVLKIIRN